MKKLLTILAVMLLAQAAFGWTEYSPTTTGAINLYGGADIWWGDQNIRMTIQSDGTIIVITTTSNDYEFIMSSGGSGTFIDRIPSWSLNRDYNTGSIWSYGDSSYLLASSFSQDGTRDAIVVILNDTMFVQVDTIRIGTGATADTGSGGSHFPVGLYDGNFWGVMRVSGNANRTVLFKADGALHDGTHTTGQCTQTYSLIEAVTAADYRLFKRPIANGMLIANHDDDLWYGDDVNGFNAAATNFLGFDPNAGNDSAASQLQFLPWNGVLSDSVYLVTVYVADTVKGYKVKISNAASGSGTMAMIDSFTVLTPSEIAPNGGVRYGFPDVAATNVGSDRIAFFYKKYANESSLDSADVYVKVRDAGSFGAETKIRNADGLRIAGLRTAPVTPLIGGNYKCWLGWTVGITATNTDSLFLASHTLTFGSPATIVTSADTLMFVADSGGSNPAGQNLTITNSGGTPLDFTLSDDSAWLEMTPTTGTDDEVVAVSIDQTNLPPGIYWEELVITDAAATNSPYTVYVKYTVNDVSNDGRVAKYVPVNRFR